MDSAATHRTAARRWPSVAIFGALLALSCLVSGCSSSDSQVEVIRLGHGLDTSHPVHIAMSHLAERASELTDGELEVRIYPSEQLGSERESVELLQIGSLGMTKVSASVLEAFAADFSVLGLPYLFRDSTHLFEVLEGGIGQELLDAPVSSRLRGLCFYDAGARSFYTRSEPVLHPDDLDGLKIRTQESATAIQMVNTLGGHATPISWGELYTALQQGVVDGAENNPPSFHLSRHYEVARHYSLDEHTFVPDVLLISEPLWQRLQPEHRRALEVAARDSAQLQKRLWAEASAEALREVQADGVEVHHPAKEPFVERARSLHDSVTDPGQRRLLERILAATPATHVSSRTDAPSESTDPTRPQASTPGPASREGS